jgi:heme-degrading monooxygenase HmoA
MEEALMYLRVTRTQTAPNRLEAATASLKETASAIRKIPGNLGLVLLADKETGAGRTVSFWDSQEAMEASEEAAGGLRSQIAQTTGATVTGVERYDLAIEHRTAPPAANTFVRINTVEGSAQGLDAGLTFMKEKVLPSLEGMAGLRAVLVGIDRGNNRSMIATIWNTAEQRQASEAQVAGLRQEATAAAEGQVTVELFEVLFADSSIGATTAR